MTNRKVALTGAAGVVGSLLRRGLRGHVGGLLLLDRESLEPEHERERCLQLDLRDHDAVREAVRDVDVVLHLGAIPVEAPFEDILDTNVRGTHHVLEACRRNGVPRFVLASSHHVTGYYERGEELDAASAPRPDSYYGVSKATGEALAAMYHFKFGLEVICVRIGTVIDRPVDRRTLSTWSSPRDTVELFRRCIDADDVDWAVVYGVSANRRRWWSDDAAGQLGYRPRDDAETFASEIEAQPETDTGPAARYQGGRFVAWDEERYGWGAIDPSRPTRRRA